MQFKLFNYLFNSLKIIHYNIIACTRQIIYKIYWGRSFAKRNTLIYVEPSKIKYKLEPIFRGSMKYGTHIKDGDWDQHYITNINEYDHVCEKYYGLIDIESFSLYSAIKNMVYNNVKFSSTDLYNNRIRSGICGKDELNKEEVKINILIKSIKKDGYKLQESISEKRWYKSFYSSNYISEVRVAIGRNGDIFLEDGVHRFFISRIIGIKSVPVRVILRHSDWQKKKHDFIKKYHNKVYTQPLHPDLETCS